MAKRKWITAVIACLLAGALMWLFSPDLARIFVGDEVEFELEKASAFQVAKTPHFGPVARGQPAECRTEPDEEVDVYPAFESSRPLFGVIRLGAPFDERDSGIEFHFAIDETQGTGRGYDRLYFDLNHDLDLTNDPPRSAVEGPPPEVAPSRTDTDTVVFDRLNVPLDFGPGVGVRPLEILPRFDVRKRDGREDNSSMWFVATTVRRGTIRIGRHRSRAVLAQLYWITGRFDCPHTQLFLIRIRPWERSDCWLGAQSLGAMHWSGGRLYTLSTTPTGDRISVKRYRGKFGLFEIGPGGRKVERAVFRGSLASPEAVVPVGELTGGPMIRVERADRCRVPVGDYLPWYLSIYFGRLRIDVSDNYHSDGRPMDRQGKPPVYGIKVREGEPFVLDFSNQPEVLFASPPEEQTFTPGDEVSVQAVLVDPVLDLMIRQCDDTTQKVQKTDQNGPGGTTRTYEINLSLDPTVTITASSGEVVAEGTMPFG